MRSLMNMAKTRRTASGGKIQVSSYPELKDWIDGYLVTARKMPGAKLSGERFDAGAIVEAAVAWLAFQDQKLRDAVISEGRKIARLIEENPGVSIDDLRDMGSIRGDCGNPGQKRVNVARVSDVIDPRANPNTLGIVVTPRPKNRLK